MNARTVETVRLMMLAEFEARRRDARRHRRGAFGAGAGSGPGVSSERPESEPVDDPETVALRAGARQRALDHARAVRAARGQG